MRSWWIILAVLPMLILGASGVCRSGKCEIAAQVCAIEVAAQIPSEQPDSCCSGTANEETNEEADATPDVHCAMDVSDAMADCCCQGPAPLSDLILCCLTPLSSVPPTQQDVLIKPTLAEFVLPMWEDSPRIAAQRHFQILPVIANTGPPPSRPSLCIWVI